VRQCGFDHVAQGAWASARSASKRRSQQGRMVQKSLNLLYFTLNLCQLQASVVRCGRMRENALLPQIVREFCGMYRKAMERRSAIAVGPQRPLTCLMGRAGRDNGGRAGDKSVHFFPKGTSSPAPPIVSLLDGADLQMVGGAVGDLWVTRTYIATDAARSWAIHSPT
jgi:hypothetical protein